MKKAIKRAMRKRNTQSRVSKRRTLRMEQEFELILGKVIKEEQDRDYNRYAAYDSNWDEKY